MKFVGIDLTSAFAARPRPIDVAVLDDELNAKFTAVVWSAAEAVVGRDPAFLTQMLREQVPVKSSERMVVAIDGPQGLATVGNTMRACERTLGTPGRTPSNIPPAEEAGVPFQGYIRSSIDLFAGLVGTALWPLAGLNGVSNFDAGLWEVFPGAEWVVLAKRRLPLKTTAAGRQARRSLFEVLEVIFPTQAVPTADQNDALVGAYLAWCVHNRPSSVELVGVAPHAADGELREGFILHSGCSLGVNLPVAQPVVAEPSTTILERPPEAATDWNDDQALLLMLSDYGVVHGTEPENAWLIPGQNYAVETTPPHAPLRIELAHAAGFSGGRGWRAIPTTRNILAQLGHPTPQHLTRQNAVTLRVVIV